MKTILLSALMLLLAMSCTTKKSSTTKSETLGDSSWIVVTLGGNIPKSVQTLELKGEKVNGKAACNAYNGKVTLSDAYKIEITGLMGTKMACDNLSEETDYFGKLRTTKKYNLSGNVLKFLDENGKVLIEFKKA